MAKRIKSLEKETNMWKCKFDGANQSLVKIMEESIAKEKELAVLVTKNQKLEKLCRALQEERNSLNDKNRKQEREIKFREWTNCYCPTVDVLHLKLYSNLKIICWKFSNAQYVTLKPRKFDKFNLKGILKPHCTVLRVNFWDFQCEIKLGSTTILKTTRMPRNHKAPTLLEAVPPSQKKARWRTYQLPTLKLESKPKPTYKPVEKGPRMRVKRTKAAS